MEHVAVAKLYSVKLAFKEIEEVRNEAWAVYHWKPQPLTDSKGSLVTNPRTREPVMLPDDRIPRLMALNTVLGSIDRRSRLAGYYSKRYAENVAAIEGSGRGVRIERIPIEEDLRQGGEELRTNEALRKSEGFDGPDDGRP